MSEPKSLRFVFQMTYLTYSILFTLTLLQSTPRLTCWRFQQPKIRVHFLHDGCYRLGLLGLVFLVSCYTKNAFSGLFKTAFSFTLHWVIAPPASHHFRLYFSCVSLCRSSIMIEALRIFVFYFSVLPKPYPNKQRHKRSFKKNIS